MTECFMKGVIWEVKNSEVPLQPTLTKFLKLFLLL